MQPNELLANGIFFLLDIILTIILIPLVLKYRNRKKINHLTNVTVTAINELMEVGGSMMIKFNQVAFRLHEMTNKIKDMTEEQKLKMGLTNSNIKDFQRENIDWLVQFSSSFHKEVDSFRSIIELFSPHFEDPEILILISKLNQNSRYAIGSMEAIITSFKLGGAIPEYVFGSINSSYKNMYDEVSQKVNNDMFKPLSKPKTMEELYNSLTDG
jgi:hypothetical protein